jgi:hypothetical protein
MLPLLLAAADTAADPLISGNWLLAVGSLLSTAAAGFYGHQRGLKKRQSVSLEEPVPTVPTRKVFDQFHSITERLNKVELNVVELFHLHRSISAEASKRESRINEKITDLAREVSSLNSAGTIHSQLLTSVSTKLDAVILRLPRS